MSAVLDPSIPMMVLVSKHTAAGAEIFAGVLQLQKRAVVVGERTSRVGGIATIWSYLSSSLAVRTGDWVLPDGTALNQGIQPDIMLRAASSERRLQMALRLAKKLKSLPVASAPVFNGFTTSSQTSSATVETLDENSKTDSLPSNDPKPSIIVLGHMSPVTEVCKSNLSAATVYLDQDAGRSLRQIYMYDVQTKEQVGIAQYTGYNTWSGPHISSPYYTRWLLRASVPSDKTTSDFSSTHRIGIVKDCNGKPVSMGFFVTPAAITDIRSAPSDTTTISQGREQRIGAFIFTSTKASPDLTTKLRSIKMLASASSNMHLSNIQIAVQIERITYQAPCLYNDPPYITCDIPDYMGEVTGDTTFTIYADITKAVGAGTVQLQLSDFGSPFQPGSVTWKNDAETFTWISPLQSTVKSTSYQIAQ